MLLIFSVIILDLFSWFYVLLLHLIKGLSRAIVVKSWCLIVAFIVVLEIHMCFVRYLNILILLMLLCPRARVLGSLKNISFKFLGILKVFKKLINDFAHLHTIVGNTHTNIVSSFFLLLFLQATTSSFFLFFLRFLCCPVVFLFHIPGVIVDFTHLSHIIANCLITSAHNQSFVSACTVRWSHIPS